MSVHSEDKKYTFIIDITSGIFTVCYITVSIENHIIIIILKTINYSMNHEILEKKIPKNKYL